MPAIAARLAVVAILATGLPLAAQTPAATLAAAGASAAEGTVAIATITLTCSDPIDGFSFGLLHPDSELALTEVVAGDAIDPAAGGVAPDYLAIDLQPAGPPGLVLGCIIDFSLVERLAAALAHPVAQIAYTVLPGSGPGSSSIVFSGQLGIPPVAVEVASGLDSIAPVTVDGTIERLAADCNGNGTPDSSEIASGQGSDCDGNGVLDECDIAAGAADVDGDGVPDLCGPPGEIPRGDCNGDGAVSIADPIFQLAFLFAGGSAPACLDACDPNDDGMSDISDAVSTLGYLFTGGAAPAPPFPACGADPTGDALPCPASPACP